MEIIFIISLDFKKFLGFLQKMCIFCGMLKMLPKETTPKIIYLLSKAYSLRFLSREIKRVLSVVTERCVPFHIYG